jgi:transcriptional regulator with XRE-family HTH domain
VSDQSTRFDRLALQDLLAEIGCRVVEIRERNGWLQSELSRRAQIQPSRLSRIERGLVIARIDELIRLSRALLVSLDDLVFDPPAQGADEEVRHLRALLAAASPEDRQAIRRFSHIFLIGYRQAGQTAPGSPAGTSGS